MCPSYKLVVRLIRPILDRPKSVSLMWPIEVIRRLRTDTAESNSSYTSDVTSFYCGNYSRSVLLVGLEVAVHDAIVV